MSLGRVNLSAAKPNFKHYPTEPPSATQRKQNKPFNLPERVCFTYTTLASVLEFLQVPVRSGAAWACLWFNLLTF